MAISAAFPLEASCLTSDSQLESGVRLLEPRTQRTSLPTVSTVGQGTAIIDLTNKGSQYIESSWTPKTYTLNTGGSQPEEMLEDESSMRNILHPIAERPPQEYIGLYERNKTSLIALQARRTGAVIRYV